MSAIFLPAYAKINLTLAVLGRRADGYHDLASVMQTVSLHDTLRLDPNATGILILQTDRADLQSDENLALRAARLLREEAGDASLGVEIELQKMIPAQGGLGGGSSDGVCVLLALNHLWDLGLSTERLATLSARLGSDTPFFSQGGTALIGGRGEVVTPLPDAQPLWLILAKPPVSVSTAAVFGALTPASYATTEDSERVVAAIRAGEPLPLDHLTNSLEKPVLAQHPSVAETRDLLLALGAPVVRMSGSGPTLYAPFMGLAEAATVYARAQARGAVCWLCHTISRATYQRALSVG